MYMRSKGSSMYYHTLYVSGVFYWACIRTYLGTVKNTRFVHIIPNVEILSVVFENIPQPEFGGPPSPYLLLEEIQVARFPWPAPTLHRNSYDNSNINDNSNNNDSNSDSN